MGLEVNPRFKAGAGIAIAQSPAGVVEISASGGGTTPSPAGQIWDTAAPSGTADDGTVWYQYIGSSADYRTEVMADSPTIFLPLDENSGTNADDISGNNNDGTYVGSPTLNQTSIVTGDVASGASAVDFAGGGKYITLPSISLHNMSFTLETWLYAASIGTLQSLWQNGDTQSANKYLHCGILTTGAVYLNYYSDDLSTAAGVIANGGLYHIVHRYNLGTDKSSIWVNGVKSTEGSNGPLNDSGTHTTLFGRTFGGSEIRSICQDIAVYAGAALSDDRIRVHYASGLRARIVIGQWMFDETLGDWISIRGIVN